MSHYSAFPLKSMLILCVCFIFIGNISAQNDCGTDRAHEYRLANDLQYSQEIRDIETRILEASLNSSGDRLETIVIPVVVHVLHLGEDLGTSSNISDAQIMGAIDGANSRWNDDNGPGVNMNIEFCLAQTDPNGNPTNGITRTDASNVSNYLTNGMSYLQIQSNESALKNLSNWPHNKYYNIWVVHDIYGDWGGFAYYPLFFNYSIDGATLDYHAMTGDRATLAHELGHGLFLIHTFDGANETNCPPNGNCQTQGDRVCDTPPHLQDECSTTSCGTGILDNTFHNYMSYCGEKYLFTAGQKVRVDDALVNTSRATLLNSTVCSPPPCPSTNTIIQETTCDTIDWGIVIDSFTNQFGCDSIITTIYNFIPSPVAGFTFLTNNLEVVFTNTSLNAITFEWDFGDGTTAGSLSSVVHSYNQSGQYSVRLVVTNDCGADTIYQTVDIVINAINTNSIIDEINLVPNPNHGSFVVELKGGATNKVIRLSLYDVEGKLMDSRNSNYNGRLLETYELKKIASGNYFLQISVEGEVSRTIQFEMNK